MFFLWHARVDSAVFTGTGVFFFSLFLRGIVEGAFVSSGCVCGDWDWVVCTDGVF